ncbi:MAG: hypothetical protein ACLRFE_03305 [Clostridia bacterium]
MTNRQLNEIINRARNEYITNGKTDKFKNLCNMIMDENNVSHIIMFTNSVPGIDVREFGLIVLRDGSAEQNFEFALIDGADTKAHREVIIKSLDVEANLKAGKQISDEYIDEYVNRHGKVVLRGTPYQNFKYLKHNKSSQLDKQSHLNMIIAKGNTFINTLCAKEIKGADILAHGEMVISSKEVQPNFHFAKIKGADTQRHLDIVSQYGNAYENFEVLTTFRNSCNIKKHVQNIFSSKDNEVKYNCLMWLREMGIMDKLKSCYELQKFVHDINSGKINIDDITNEDRDDYLY